MKCKVELSSVSIQFSSSIPVLSFHFHSLLIFNTYKQQQQQQKVFLQLVASRMPFLIAVPS